MSRKLHYFDINGLGEAIRYILHYGRLEFEDIRHERKNWPNKSVKDSLPYGQFPVYEENGKTVNQSLAIARYVGSQVNLVPKDPWEQALLDATAFNIYDFWKKIVEYIFTPEGPKKEALKEEIFNVTVDYFFSRFEKELKDKNGFFNGKLSWVDFVLVGIVETFDVFFGVEVEKKYPTVKNLVQHIRSLPGIKEYISTLKPYAI